MEAEIPSTYSLLIYISGVVTTPLSFLKFSYLREIEFISTELILLRCRFLLIVFISCFLSAAKNNLIPARLKYD